jgi:hypothetical protein
MSPYQRFVDSLSDAQLQQLMRGEVGIGCSDDGYCLVENGGVKMQDDDADTDPRSRLRDREGGVLGELYQNQPLCRAEFDYQAEQLLERHGAENFCRRTGSTGSWALMIDGLQLVAVEPEDVRCQYGYFCDIEEHVVDDEAAARTRDWLTSGEAYEDYRSKTTCRYCWAGRSAAAKAGILPDNARYEVRR